MNHRIVLMLLFVSLRVHSFDQKELSIDQLKKKVEQEVVESLLGQLNPYARPTVIQTINRYAIELAPIIMPIVISILLDYGRSYACDKVVSYVLSDAKIMDTPISYKDVARVGIEAGSRIALNSVLYGHFDEKGSFKVNMNDRMIKYACIDAAHFAISRYGVPHVFKKINTHVESSSGEKYDVEKTIYGKTIKGAWALYVASSLATR